MHENHQKIFLKFLKQFSVLNIRKMASHYKNKKTLKNLPVYSEEIKSVKKNDEKNSNTGVLSELPFFYKKNLKIN